VSADAGEGGWSEYGSEGEDVKDFIASLLWLFDYRISEVRPQVPRLRSGQAFDSVGPKAGQTPLRMTAHLCSDIETHTRF